jgi:DNA-3-methyladenine glycosylase
MQAEKKRRILPRNFYERKAEIVARELLGKLIVRKIRGRQRIVRVTETEAYLGPHDLASHSRFGKTRRNAAMFGPPGRAYVYLIYGMYHCLNIVTGREGDGAAVLLRAGAPMQNITGKTTGPGLLCRALNIDRVLNGAQVTRDGLLFLADDGYKIGTERITAGPRVGVAYAQSWRDKPLRFCYH